MERPKIYPVSLPEFKGFYRPQVIQGALVVWVKPEG
jgi:hypothetical protein